MRYVTAFLCLVVSFCTGLSACKQITISGNNHFTNYLYSVQGVIRYRTGTALTDQEMRMTEIVQGTADIAGEEGHAIMLLSQSGAFKPLCLNAKNPGDTAVQARTADGNYAYRILARRDLSVSASSKNATIIVTKFATKPGVDAFYPCLEYITDYSVNVWQMRHVGP